VAFKIRCSEREGAVPRVDFSTQRVSSFLITNCIFLVIEIIAVIFENIIAEKVLRLGIDRRQERRMVCNKY
jgi:hypothetical protein